MKRPSHKELYNKIRGAKEAVSSGLVNIINQEVIACASLDSVYLLESDLLNVLSSFLGEISPDNYVGKKPPEKSYEHKIQNMDLFAFRMDSSWFKCKVYLKFALYDGELWLVSLHQYRERKEVS